MSLENINRIVELTGKTHRTIKARVDKLTPIQEGKALLYETKEALPLIYGLDTQSAYNLEQERARLAHHQANNEALREETLKKTLIPAEQVRESWETMISRFKAKMLSIPSKMAHQMASSSDHHEIETLLRKGIMQALEELAAND